MNHDQRNIKQTPWKSRLIASGDEERRQKIQEGRARHRAETGQQPPTKNPANGVQPQNPVTPCNGHPQPDQPHPDPNDLQAMHSQWLERLADWLRTARDNNASATQPDTVAGRQLQREATRVHRLISDILHQTTRGFLHGLNNTNTNPPEGEPQRSAYTKGYASGHEAAQAQAKRTRHKRNRIKNRNQPELQAKEG